MWRSVRLFVQTKNVVLPFTFARTVLQQPQRKAKSRRLSNRKSSRLVSMVIKTSFVPTHLLYFYLYLQEKRVRYFVILHVEISILEQLSEISNRHLVNFLYCRSKLSHTSTIFLLGSICGLIDFVNHRDVGFNIDENKHSNTIRYFP